MNATLHKVHEDELEAIRIRRTEALLDRHTDVKGGERSALPPKEKEALRKNLVGLALSGGGLRSAMFNLGLLQSFQSAGLMRFVDYLSTVSGGGYVGGYYSALGNVGRRICTPEETGGSVVSAGDKKSQASPPLVSNQLPPLADATHRFINAGLYLNQPWSFLARYLRVTAPFFLMYMSLLVALASGTALFFRQFDRDEMRDALELINMGSDVGSLLVASVLFWFVLVALYMVWERLFPTSNSVFGRRGTWISLSAFAFACGIAVFLGNYDVGLIQGGSWFQGKQNSPLVFFTIAAIAALVMTRFPLLLKSDRSTARGWQKIALWLVVLTTVGGGSLAVISLMSRENLSGYASTRGPWIRKNDFLSDRALVAFVKHHGALTDNNQILGRAIESFEAKLNQSEANRRLLFPDESDHTGFMSTGLGLESLRRVMRWADEAVARWSTPQNSGDTAKNSDSGAGVHAYFKSEEELRVDRSNLAKDLNAAVFGEDGPVLRAESACTVADWNKRQWLFNAFDARFLKHKSSPVPPSAATDLTEPAGELDPLKDWLAIKAYVDSFLEDRPYLEAKPVLTSLRSSIGPNGKLTFPEGYFSHVSFDIFTRQLLEITFPDTFRQRRFISTPVVVEPDQHARWICLGIASALFLVCACVVDFNEGAVFHQFYCERLSKTFIKAATNDHWPADRPLSMVKPWENGFPYPLIVAGLKLPGTIDLNSRDPRELHSNPAKIDGSVGSEWYSFLLSPLYVGYLPCLRKGQAAPVSYKRTEFYLNDRLLLSSAVTLSGAAVTPWMTANPLLNFLMHVFNLRLEQWLPNPSWSVSETAEAKKREEPVSTRFPLIRKLVAYHQCATPEGRKKWRWGVVADGGFREFLGVEELIARRCKVVIVSDAGCNNGLSEFGVLADLVRQLRLDHGVEILDLDHDLPLETDRIRRQENGRVIQHFLVGRIRYPEDAHRKTLSDRSALFVYLQMSLTGDEEIDLSQFQKINPRFPDEPITNQFYSPDQVESLRQLGEHVGKHLCQRLDANSIGKIVDNTTRTQELASALVAAYLLECRQESLTDMDEASPEWPSHVDELGLRTDRVSEAFEEFEDRGHGSRKIARFSAIVLDCYDREKFSVIPHNVDDLLSKGSQDLAAEITPEALPGLAVECNRRHAGFRSENPSRYFRVGGRRILLRSAYRALAICGTELTGLAAKGQGASFILADPQTFLSAVGRLAVLLNSGIFRRYGLETACDVTLCLIAWYEFRYSYSLEIAKSIQTEGKHPLPILELHWTGPVAHKWHELLRSADFRMGLRRAVKTDIADEVRRYLTTRLCPDVPPSQASFEVTDSAPQPGSGQPGSTMNPIPNGYGNQ